MTTNKISKCYRYQATNKRGQRSEGIIEAHSVALAKAQLSRQGLSNITLTPAATSIGRWQPAISAKQMLLGFQTLATLLQSGIVLTQALQIASQNSQSARLADILQQVKTDIESGHSFAQALRQHPKVFDSFSVALIDAGEQSGALDVMLQRIAIHHEKQQILTSKLLQAIRYPAIILCTAMVVVAVLLIKVIPAFAASFSSMGQELPLATRIVLELSALFVNYFWLMALTMLLVIIAFVINYRRNDVLRLRLAAISLHLPIFGKLIQAIASARFAQTLAMTFGAGIELMYALELSGKATDNPIFMQATQSIKSQVHSGKQLYSAMHQSQLFSAMSVQMVRVGEESGRLVTMLEKVASYHEQEVDNTTKTLLGLLEPMMIVVLGVIIGGLIVAMYLPIFTLGNQI